jgi:LytR cell envelope-related transcriptional attenuator
VAAGSVRRVSGAPRYRKRRPLPAIILILVLCAASTFVWFKVMHTADTSADKVTCAPPAPIPTSSKKKDKDQPPATLGKSLDRDALAKTAPAPPSTAQVRVLNATTERGKANQVSAVLGELGFAKLLPAQNDPVYAAQDMSCQGQIRFGQRGMATARTLNLIEPCAELIKDERTDATVDLVVGEKFGELRPTQEARKMLMALTDWAHSHPAAHGGLQDAQGQRFQVDPKLISEAQDARC